MRCAECGATILLPVLTRSQQKVNCPNCQQTYRVAMDGRPPTPERGVWWREPPDKPGWYSMEGHYVDE